MRETKGRTDTKSLPRKSRENSSYRQSNDDIVKLRRARKLEQRRKEKRSYTARDWAAPVPSNLVAKLEIPKHRSKYQSYFEFADNPEKKEKKLRFHVTNNIRPPPEYAFVPIGDPALTNACKELSREKEAMFFIVSTCKEDHSRISEHVYRVGYHFRETVLNAALKNLGERKLQPCSKHYIEPIPETQEEINKQADAAIRDLFPKIPNTDRQLIIEHSFKKGALFQGEPTVGTQSNIPLSRRVQLAVLAHIRHTHTRYDKLLRETSWINARKAVEPVCLDFILKWRGNEENGRDQMDEILREVVIITDSENDDEDDQSTSTNNSDEDDAIISCGPSESNFQSSLRNRTQALVPANDKNLRGLPPKTYTGRKFPANQSKKDGTRDRQPRRGFKRYQVALEEALNRQQQPRRPANDMPISQRLPHNRDYLYNEGPHFVSSAHNPILFDSMDQISHHDVDYRQEHINKNSLVPLHSHALYYGNHPEASTYRIGELQNYNPDFPVHYQNFTHRAGSISNSRLRQVSPHVMARHSHQNVLVESIETASSKYSVPRTENRVSDRFSYTQHTFPLRSNELLNHDVEPIIATSNIPPPYDEERASDRLDHTQNSHSRWSSGLRHQIGGPNKAAPNEIILSHKERHVSDRFNYTQNPYSLRSHGFRQNMVESIKVTSNGNMPSYKESHVSNRASCTQNTYHRRSEVPRYEDLSHHQVVIIDDDSPSVESRRKARYREPNSSIGYPPQNDTFATNQNSTPYYNNSSDQSRVLNCQEKEDLPRLIQSPSLRPTIQGSSFVIDPSAANAHSTFHLASQSGPFKRAGAKTVPKSYIELVDLTLDGSSSICEAQSHCSANDYSLDKTSREMVQNDREYIRNNY